MFHHNIRNRHLSFYGDIMLFYMETPHDTWGIREGWSHLYKLWYVSQEKSCKRMFYSTWDTLVSVWVSRNCAKLSQNCAYLSHICENLSHSGENLSHLCEMVLERLHDELWCDDSSCTCDLSSSHKGRISGTFLRNEHVTYNGG